MEASVDRRYIHEHPEWPRLTWDATELAGRLAAVRHNQGRLLGRIEALGLNLQRETMLESMTDEAQMSSEIEGEMLDRESVRSSIARRLGIDMEGDTTVDRRVEGVVEMTVDATRGYSDPLTAERLFGWHAALFPVGYSGARRITVGSWRTDRDGPMQVVSGPIGRERVHYVAPSASRLDQEMNSFLAWFNEERSVDPVLMAGLAHLRFVLIHPFDDGNGRIARAIAESALARADRSPLRFYSMSAQIRQERRAYYQILDRTGTGELDVTPWLTWFLDCLDRSFEASESKLKAVMKKTRHWDHLRTITLNERQRLMVNRLLDGFEGKLTTTKWAKLSKTSQDTAYRDILDLVARGVLVRGPAGGRSASYILAHDDER
jgi:Fic family protein